MKYYLVRFTDDHRYRITNRVSNEREACIKAFGMISLDMVCVAFDRKWSSLSQAEKSALETELSAKAVDHVRET